MRKYLFRCCFGFALWIFQSCGQTSNTHVAAGQGNSEVEDIVFSVNAYSFSDLLSATYPQSDLQLYSLLNLLDWFKYKGIQAIDPTAYFFPGYPDPPSDAFLDVFKRKAEEYGIAISGTGIRNDFANPDPQIRAEGIQRAIQWLEVASKLEAPVLRCFAGKLPQGYEDQWEIPAQWVIESVQLLIPYAQKYGVKIGIQNHGDMLKTAEQCAYILEKLDSPWVGLVLDTGHFHTTDPYKDIELMTPYAVNWQIKEFVDGNQKQVAMDYAKIVKIIKTGGYKGFVPVESLKEKDVPYDPFERVDRMLKILETEMRK